MGEVYRATAGEREYALKIYKADDDSGAVEYNALLLLEGVDETVCGYVDHGHVGTRFFIVTEYEPGSVTVAWVAKRLAGCAVSRERMALVARILLDTTRCLGRLHAADIAHRDVHGANIVLLPPPPGSTAVSVAAFLDGEGAAADVWVETRLIDFDKACCISASEGCVSDVLRDPDWQRSENWAASDVWGVGEVAIMLLYGRLPLEIVRDTSRIAPRRLAESYWRWNARFGAIKTHIPLPDIFADISDCLWFPARYRMSLARAEARLAAIVGG